MFELPTPIILGIASILAVVLFLFFWRAVNDLSFPMKVAARLLLTVVLILPMALVLFGNQFDLFQSDGRSASENKSISVPSTADQDKRDDVAGAAPDAEPPAQRGIKKKSVPETSREKVAVDREPKSKPSASLDNYGSSGEGASGGGIGGALAPGAGGSSQPAAPAMPSGGLPDVAAPQDPPNTMGAPARPKKIKETAKETGGFDDGVTDFEAMKIEEEPREAAVSADGEAAPLKPEADWTVVPVYFGTDRMQKPDTKRLEYGWQRARRMELGRALVTIPKVHVVPMVERPWALRIPYLDITIYEAEEDPQKHFTIQDMKTLSREEFLALVREKIAKASRFKDHALIFIHGYKNHFDNAVFRTAQIAYDLKYDSAPFLYSWPSGGTLQGYTYDRDSAAQAEPYLKEFLDLVVNETGAKKVSIIAHSMGNQLLLRVLQDLKRSKPDEVLISQLILAAPDVDRDTFENIVKSIKGISEGVTLYTAANDAALRVSRQVNGGVPRAGDVPESGPIVVEGVDTIDATATSMDSIGINHSGYAENNALLSDIGKLIATGQRPPELRVPSLERVTTPKGDYWRYPKPAP